MTNGIRPLNQSRASAKRSSSHFGDFNATSHHLATHSTNLGSFPVQPDTLGCSVFRCGVDRIAKRTKCYTWSPLWLTEVAPLLKALLPKFHWLIKARLSKVNLKVTSIKWHHTANCALVELEPRGQGTPVHDRYLPSRKGR